MRWVTAMRAASMRRVEAVRGGAGGHHRQRRFPMAAVQGHQQIGGLGLGGHARGRSGALDVDHQQGQLHRHRQADRLGLEVHARPARGGHGQAAGEGGAERHVGRGDLVLGLDRVHPETPVARQGVQQLGGRGDRVGGEEEPEPGLDAGRDQAQGERLGAVDVAVGAGRCGRRLDLVVNRQQLGGLAEVVARPERGEVGVAQRRRVLELLLDPGDARLRGAAVHPGDEAEREEVLAALCVAGGDSLDVLGGAHGHRGHRHAEELVVVERVVLERVVLVARLAQVVVGEAVLVDDDHAALLHRPELGDESGRVHRHEHVGVVSGREDVARGEVDLEGRHAGRGARRGSDLGREVGERGEVVANDRGGVGEATAGELHPVAGVAGKADDDAVDLLESLLVHERAACSGPVVSVARWPGGQTRVIAAAREVAASCR